MDITVRIQTNSLRIEMLKFCMYRREYGKRVGRLYVHFCTYKSDRDATINSPGGYCRRRLHPSASSTKPSRSATLSRPQSAQSTQTNASHGPLRCQTNTSPAGKRPYNFQFCLSFRSPSLT